MDTTAAKKSTPYSLPLDDRLTALLAQTYPAFSADEMHRRRRLLTQVMDTAGVDHLLVYGAQRNGSGVQWLSGWPVTAEAALVFTPEKTDRLFVQYFNHVPLARRLAAAAEVSWGGTSTLQSVLDELDRRGTPAQRIGVIGPLSFSSHKILTAKYPSVVDLNPAYIRLRMIKSAEEIDWLRIGATLSDRAIYALRAELRPGLSERELTDIVERAYVPLGGTTHIHYFGVTAMQNPDCCVPAQFPSSRRLQAGDVVFCEISAAFWDYPGQVLRTFTIGEAPAALYRELHGVAEAAFDAVVGVLRAGARPEQIVAAAALIEDAGFTTCDDLLHGFGGGYLPPVIGARSRPSGSLPDITLAAGMTVVVQPNIVTRNGRAGVQTGELLLITETGVEHLHHAPRGIFQVAA